MFCTGARIGLKSTPLHVLACKAFHGECPSGMTVDHIDRDRLNNTASNLRYATPSQQALNSGRSKYTTGRKVYQFTRSGEYVGEYDALPRAVEAAAGTSVGGISQCCLGKSREHAGYVWSYQEPKGK